MSVKSFKFVSPGVFINEIDNSFVPQSAQATGPVVIGRASRGIAMTPIQVQSYSDFVTMFGDTVPGNRGGDVFRDGNQQSPMYGTYAAKAFLRANVAPLTYVRVLGQENYTTDGSSGDAGWKNPNNANKTFASNGGAYGMFIFHSGNHTNCAEGNLAAVWYIDNGQLALSGTVRGGLNKQKEPGSDKLYGGGGTTGSAGVVIGRGDDGLWTMIVAGTSNSDLAAQEKIKFNFDESSENYVRKKFNTNPQLGNSNASDFYPAASEKSYWLGESYEAFLRDGTDPIATHGDGVSLLTGSQAVLLPLQNTAGLGMHQRKQESREAVAGWFIGQDLGSAASYVPFNQQKLFRLIGRGHGEWLSKNVKVSIEKIRTPTSNATKYGTFSLVLRNINDTDNNVVVLERYDNLSLDPTSVNFIARRIGDKYVKWDSTEKRLKEYGEYDNQSNIIYVEMNTDVEAGATDASLLPVGYFGPPKFTDIIACVSGAYEIAEGGPKVATSFITGGTVVAAARTGVPNKNALGQRMTEQPFLSGGSLVFAVGSTTNRELGNLTGSLRFPKVRLRNSASDGGLSDPTKAYFGFQTTQQSASSTSQRGIADAHGLLYTDFPSDPVTTGWQATAGVDAWSYVFSLDDIVSGSSGYFYSSGSRAIETSVTTASLNDLLEPGYNRYTAPFWGGHDGFDITKPDPLYNAGMSENSTDVNSYIYHTLKRAIDTVADPEAVDMNMLAVPGLTLSKLTDHVINTCEDRADTMALIDLPDVYIPPHESYKSTKADRIGTTPLQAAKALRDRDIDSSYGATFYPWVQTRDETTGQLVWLPPTTAIMGVLASSQATSELWFAPAGFNRGGLTDGAAGIAITGITERLTSKDRDNLYESSINPIASFPNTGIVLFGQKTLQERQSALDRINVRRLVIFLKKQISILSTQVLFEQNVQATWNRFKSLVEPFLANVKTRFGITDYKLILDESTTTPDLIDQNIMYAKIMIKPARAIEYIAIDFVVASTGASFDD